ncbi:MAG TPA: hypothetical protein VK925_00340 [Jiangellaceae bacterium]|nr:hypothetical protein [Jiangellaceae bacterium]
MTVVVIAGLAAVAAGAALLWVPAVSRALDTAPWWLVAGLLSAALGVLALAAWSAGTAPDTAAAAGAAAPLAVAVAVLGGAPVATAVLRGAERSGVTGVSYPAETLEPEAQSAAMETGPVEPARGADVLRGGLWIGALERAAVAVSLLVGQPGGLALVLAVKGLGRYPELRSAGAAAERFIIGTFVSFLWAAAAAGVALLLR